MSLPAWRTEIIYFLDFVRCMHAFSCASLLSIVRTLFREFREFRHPWSPSKTAINQCTSRPPLWAHDNRTLFFILFDDSDCSHSLCARAFGTAAGQGHSLHDCHHNKMQNLTVFACAVHPDYERIEKWRMCWNDLRTRKAFRMQPWLPDSLPSYARLALLLGTACPRERWSSGALSEIEGGEEDEADNG